MNSVVALFVLLVITLVINPLSVYNIYSTILGRLVLIAVIIFFSMNNLTLGLLCVLAIIIILNTYDPLTEGMTIGEDNEPITGTQQVLTKQASANNSSSPTISQLKTQNINEPVGVDKEDIRNSILPKDSKSIQINPDMLSSEEVNAFNPSMMGTSSSLTEGFYPSAAPV